MVVKITNDNFEEEVLKSDKPVLLDFWADWCGPCKMIAPALEEISEELADKVTIAGELEGNIEAATRVELQQTGAITGDVKAGSLTVAAGARMRGQAVFGWEEDKRAKPEKPGG